jgi:hypothetical protein
MKTAQLHRNVKKDKLSKDHHRIRRNRREMTTIDHKHKQEIITFRDIDKAEAKKEIQNYLNEHPEGSLTSRIIESLRIDPLLTSNILEELKHEGLALSKSIE